ncbi:MAG: putative drug exporter of the superfamily [Acidimicrobiaceae bacterium]|jgi:RND superfamily putative drug exporter|nr:putative drug exporter of the superfamily [Acidimicrobiaceae bacterium]
MLNRLAAFVVRRGRIVLLAALVATIAAAAIGGGVASHLSSGGFFDPNAPSSKAHDLLASHFHTGDPNMVLLVTAKVARGAPAYTPAVDDPAIGREALAVTEQLGREPSIGSGQVTSYWSLGNAPPLRSKDGTQALILARVTGSDDQVTKSIKAIAPRYQLDNSQLAVEVGGQAQVFHQVGTQVQEDLKRAEMLSLLPTLLLLLLIFRSAVASLLPVAIGALCVVGTLLVLRVITLFTHVSIFSLNLTTALGLGLAIDYSLFIVSRFREEVHRGLDPSQAVVRTIQTAGRTVVFSATTVAVSLAALLVFPLYFLKSFAYAGIAVTILAAVGAVVVLPAILAVLGPRVDLGTLGGRLKARTIPDTEHGFWHRLATTVMRRPVVMGGAVVVLLVVLGSPFRHISFGLPDDRVLPSSATSHLVHQAIRTNFTGNEASAAQIVAPTADPRAAAVIGGYAARLSMIAHVGRVDATTGSYAGGQLVAPPNAASARFTAPGQGGGTWLSAVPTVDPQSAQAETLVHAIRGTPAPFPIIVGGQSAQLVDSKASLGSKLPLAGALIALVTFSVLFLMTGSVVVPVKALVLNLLSLTATFGAMVWIFQQGHLAHFFNFTATGRLETTTPILMFCIAFGLSMDYEVFLLSRIKEEHDRTGDNVSSVALGLERTGRIVTAAALLLAVIFTATATSEVTFLKMFGVGLTMAVLVDATLVRGVLVPAFMRLAGEANWWAPEPLQRLYHRIGLSEGA